MTTGRDQTCRNYLVRLGFTALLGAGIAALIALMAARAQMPA